MSVERWTSETVLRNVKIPHMEIRRYNAAVDQIVRFLQCRDELFAWSIRRVVKSGSLCKGTAVRGQCDVDLVCFIEKCPSRGMVEPEDFLRYRTAIISDIAEKVARQFNWSSRHSNTLSLLWLSVLFMVLWAITQVSLFSFLMPKLQY